MNIPGTVLEMPENEAAQLQDRFGAMFLAGGIMLGQVTAITGLETHTIQNWVKRGFLSPPENKRYSLEQLCRIINIHMLRAALPLEDICGLLQYVNGALDSEADDLIRDSQLYFLFVRLAVHCKDHLGAEGYLDTLLADYEEPVPGAKARVEQVLRVMVTAWAAAQLRQKAENMVRDLKMM